MKPQIFTDKHGLVGEFICVYRCPREAGWFHSFYQSILPDYLNSIKYVDLGHRKFM